MKILVTGGAGFIGSNFVHHVLERHKRYELIVFDKLTYAGNLNNLKDVMSEITFIKGDISSRKEVEKVMKDCDCVINFAAETHVDKSIIKADTFIKTDMYGVHMLLELSRTYNIEKFIQISTDEVYGSIEKGSFKEESPLNPSNPYSASKAGADLLAMAYYRTYSVPVIITRSSNNYGPYQHPEKFLPKMIINAFLNKPLPIYGDGEHVRDWLYVMDNCEAIDLILHKGKKGEVYNVCAGDEKANIDIAKAILQMLGKSEDLITFVKNRPAHDRRYSMDCEEMRKLGWNPHVCFREGLKKTIDWYKSNEWWWRPIIVKANKFEYWKMVHKVYGIRYCNGCKKADNSQATLNNGKSVKGCAVFHLALGLREEPPTSSSKA